MSKTAAPCIVIFELLKTGASPRSFDCGGQIPTGGGGTDSGESKPPNPYSHFSSDFAHFILERLGNPKNGKYSENFLLKSRFLGMSP